MADSSFIIPGYVNDPQRYADVMAERHSAGDLVMASQNNIAGEWERLKASGVTYWNLRDSELVLLGGYRRPYLQRAGTCVSRGSARAAQASIDYAIAKLGAMYEAVEVTFATIYTMARVEIGKNRCGWGDGAILADAALAMSRLGVGTSALFKGLTEDQVEQLAVKYAAPNSGTPQAWKEACKTHTCRTFAPDTLSLMFDAVASGYGTSYAAQYITGMPDRNGLSRLGGSGAHARAVVGLYVDSNGNDQFIGQESWGRFPAEQSPQSIDQTMPVEQIPCVTIQTATDRVKLPPGCVGLDAKQFWSAIQNGGEAWTIAAPDYSGDKIADMVSAVNTV